jgi:hypothetical protein
MIEAIDNSRSERIRRLRLSNLRKLFHSRYGYVFPDDDAGRDDLYELLLPISVGANADIKMRKVIEVWAPWMMQDEAGELIDRINMAPIWDRKPGAKELGIRLRVTNGERNRLKLWTIAPYNMNKQDLLTQRKARARERMRRLRQLRGAKFRAAYLANSASRQKPWEKQGVSRRTWERRRRVASPCALILGKAANALATAEQASKPKKGRAIPHDGGRARSKPTKAEQVKREERNTADAATDRVICERTCVTSEAVTDRVISGHTCVTADGWWRNSRTPDERLDPWTATIGSSSAA